MTPTPSLRASNFSDGFLRPCFQQTCSATVTTVKPLGAVLLFQVASSIKLSISVAILFEGSKLSFTLSACQSIVVFHSFTEMAKLLSKTRSVFSELGFLCASYSESLYQLSDVRNSENSVVVDSKFEVLFVNRFAAYDFNTFDAIATADTLYYKDNNTLISMLNLIKCKESQFLRVDNLKGTVFSCADIPKAAFVDMLHASGFIPFAYDFESWVILSGGMVENVLYKDCVSKHVYPKLLTDVVEVVDFSVTHFPVIGRVSKTKYEDFLKMYKDAFTDFDTHFNQKKYIRFDDKRILTVDDYRRAVDYNYGENADLQVVGRHLFYRHELSHNKVMESAGYDYTKSDVSFGVHFSSAPAVIKSMSPDYLRVSHVNKTITVHETFVTNSPNVTKIANKKRAKYGLVASYFSNYTTTIFVNGISMYDPALSVIESNPLFNPATLIEEFVEMERKMSSFAGYAESRKLLMEDTDEETHILKEEAYTVFADWVVKNTAKFPKSADLSVMYTETSNSVMRGNGLRTTTVDDDAEVKRLRSKVDTIDTQEYVNNMANKIIENVRSSKYNPDLNRVFENTGANVINFCKDSLNKIEGVRPESKMKKLFKFPIVTADRNSVEPFDIMRYPDVKVSKWGVRTSKHLKHTSYDVDTDYSKVSGDEGLGVYKEDLTFIDSALDYLYTSSSDSFRAKIDKLTENMSDGVKSDFRYMCQYRVFEVAFNLSGLATNIACLSGMASKGHKGLVTRSYDSEGYLLHMLPCVPPTTNTNVSYFLESRASAASENDLSEWFHTFRYPMSKATRRTRVLTIGISDLSHFESAFYVLLTFVKLMADVKQESDMSDVGVVEMMSNKSIRVMSLVLLAHIKSTSTMLQDLRYTLMSTTALYADLMNHVTESFSKPCRSVIDSYIQQYIYVWIQKTIAGRDELFKNIVKSGMRIEGVRIMVPDFFEDSRVEFTFLLSVVYCMSFAKKTLGSKYLKSMSILEKMADMEIAFLESRESNSKMKGEVDSIAEFIASADVKLEYDEKAYIVAGKLTKSFLERSYFPFEKEAIACMKIPISDIATSKSSLYSIGNGNIDIPELPTCFLKGTALETTARIMRLTGNLTCFLNLSAFDLLVAIFLLFAKDQTGSDREILQQAIQLRSCLLPVESYYKSMMPFFAEDTSSRKDLKEMYQMQTMQRVHGSFLSEWNIEKVFGMTYSLNADMSKFSPSFLMKALSAFAIAMKIPELMDKATLTILKAFGAKVCKIPLALSKLDPESFVANNAAKQWVIDNLDIDTKAITFFSGMGQGMLFFYTCTVVLGKHLLEMSVMDCIKSKLSGTFKELQASLMCSDDITKLGFIIAGKNNTVFELMRYVLVTFNSVCRLMGLHPSWKKVNLHLMISEFNSFFSQRMRPIVSYLKWLMAVFMTREMDYPEYSCRDVLSACYELFKKGASLRLLAFILEVSRFQMVHRMRLSDILPELKNMLCCNDKELPIELGIIPTTNPLVLLTAGTEHFIHKEMSNELRLFYRGLYSRSTSTLDEFNNQSDLINKYKFYLYKRTLKSKTRRAEFRKQLSLDRQKALKIAEENALLCLDYRCMPANILKTLHMGHMDLYDAGKDALSVKALVTVLGIANKLGAVEGMELEEAKELLGEDLEAHYKKKFDVMRFSDLKIFARLMIAKGAKTMNNHFLNLLSFNKRFVEIESDLDRMAKFMFPVRKNIPYYMRTVHLSGMSVLEEVDVSTIVMSMFSDGSELRNMDEEHAQSFNSLKIFKAAEAMKEALGLKGDNSPLVLINKILTIFKDHEHPMTAFRNYIVRLKKRLGSMTFSTAMLKRDNSVDLRSTMMMLQLQRQVPGVLFAIREKADSSADYISVMSSLCTLLRDSDIVYGKLMDKLSDDGFGDMADTLYSKTHPKELFLKISWNLYTEGHLNHLNITRPYKCQLWNDINKRTCFTDFVCIAIVKESVLTEEFKTFKIQFYVPVSQVRYKSSLWLYIKRLAAAKERAGFSVVFAGSETDDDVDFIHSKVPSFKL